MRFRIRTLHLKSPVHGHRLYSRAVFIFNEPSTSQQTCWAISQIRYHFLSRTSREYNALIMYYGLWGIWLSFSPLSLSQMSTSSSFRFLRNAPGCEPRNHAPRETNHNKLNFSISSCRQSYVCNFQDFLKIFTILIWGSKVIFSGNGLLEWLLSVTEQRRWNCKYEFHRLYLWLTDRIGNRPIRQKKKWSKSRRKSRCRRRFLISNLKSLAENVSAMSLASHCLRIARRKLVLLLLLLAAILLIGRQIFFYFYKYHSRPGAYYVELDFHGLPHFQ